MELVWKPIPEYEGFYEVSNTGLIRSIDRVSWNGHAYHARKGKLLKIQTCRYGYQQVCLCKGQKHQKLHKVHKLVALAFIGQRPEGLIICHNDGNKKNNLLSNLRYDTYISNMVDSSNHGTLAHGSRLPQSKLTLEKAKQIKYLIREGLKTQREIASDFGVHYVTINDIAQNKTWKRA